MHSKEAAQALLSRVYLYMENNDKTIEYADKVINSGKYSLLSTTELPLYSTKTPENNQETILLSNIIKMAIILMAGIQLVLCMLIFRMLLG